MYVACFRTRRGISRAGTARSLDRASASSFSSEGKWLRSNCHSSATFLHDTSLEIVFMIAEVDFILSPSFKELKLSPLSTAPPAEKVSGNVMRVNRRVVNSKAV